jgi:cytochrome c oxidase cbb3-type subunit 3
MQYSWCFYVIFFCNSISAETLKEGSIDPSIAIGAKVYSERCVDCHGRKGTGNGTIALNIKDYPKLNLQQSLKSSTEEEIREAVIYGRIKQQNLPLMPPMGNELSWSETEAVVNFMLLLKSDYSTSIAMVNKVSEVVDPSIREGSELFLGHCILCHGKHADGKGRMARIITKPPPANLTYSRLPDNYLKKIISGGGEPMGRSPQMPPWQDEFSSTQIDSIILYIKSIRS